MRSPTIRALADGDRDRVLEIWLAASRVGHPFLDDATLQRQQVLVRDHYLPLAETWVAGDRDGRIVGFIGLLDRLIGGLFVDPSCHRTGVGRALVAHAASLKGELAVEVYLANAPARAFYARLGFRETARRETDDAGQRLPLLHLRRPADVAPPRG